MREERIVVAGRELLIARPDDPESLIDEERFEEDEFLPYWAELWPSGVALADYVATLDLAGPAGARARVRARAAVVRRRARGRRRALPRTGLPRLSRSSARNAAANGLRIATALAGLASSAATRHRRRSMSSWPRTSSTRSETPCPCSAARTRPRPTEGIVLIADPGRRHAAAFFERAGADGWSIEHVPANEIPSGGIAILRRPCPPSDDRTSVLIQHKRLA